MLSKTVMYKQAQHLGGLNRVNIPSGQNRQKSIL